MLLMLPAMLFAARRRADAASCQPLPPDTPDIFAPYASPYTLRYAAFMRTCVRANDAARAFRRRDTLTPMRYAMLLMPPSSRH